MINWNEIETVMLDMDGTLLDLHFDNYFWQEYLPKCWGEANGMDIDTAKETLIPKFKAVEGTLAWYCLDYWSSELGLDVFRLKYDVAYLIKTRPHAEELLFKLNKMGKEVVLLTNAHEKILDVKLKKTRLRKYFDHIISAHTLGSPKEHNEFWELLANTVQFNQEKSLFIDDNPMVLLAAQRYGVRHLLSIAKPDSHVSARTSTDFPHIGNFRELFSAEYINA